MKAVKLTISLVIFLLTFTNFAEASQYYQVSGNSMSPTFQHGDVIELIEDEPFKEGDTVIARLKNGRMVIKRWHEGVLKGDNHSSRTYDSKSIDEILGKVELQTQTQTKSIHSTLEKAFAESDKKISADSYRTYAINSNGELYAWGRNNYGQLGLGDTTDRRTPTKVGTATNWVQVSTGRYSWGAHTLAINSNGEIYAWGKNSLGQLGSGDTTDRLSPTKVGTATNWVQVSTGTYHSVAINSNGELFTWGYNGYGQLGHGDTTNRSVPTKVGTDTDWAQVSAGEWHTLALKSNGELWSMGRNSYGQLGIGNTYDRKYPVRVGSATNWVKIASDGQSHNLALNTNGELYAWGSNGAGQIGKGKYDFAQQLSPVRVETNKTDWVDIATGDNKSSALNANGEIYVWGDNEYSKDYPRLGVGFGYGEFIPFPTKQGPPTNWRQFSLGSTHGISLNANGEIYTWGGASWDTYGALGHGSDNHKEVPTIISGFQGVVIPELPPSYGSSENENSPQLTLTSPDDAQTYYKGDVIKVEGTKTDPNNDTTSVEVQLNNGTWQTIVASSTTSSFSEDLTITNGRLYHNLTDLGALIDSTLNANTLKIRSKNTSEYSTEVSRSFTTFVTNQNPTLSITSAINSPELYDGDTYNLEGITNDMNPDTLEIKYDIVGANVAAKHKNTFIKKYSSTKNNESFGKAIVINKSDFNEITGTYDMNVTVSDSTVTETITVTLNLMFDIPASVPPSITYDNGSVKSGDTKVISWGSSDFGTGGTSYHYQLEYYDGSSWVSVDNNIPSNQTSFTHTIPSSVNTNIAKYQVRACKLYTYTSCSSYQTGTTEFYIDNTGPSANFSINGSTIWSKSRYSKVNVTDNATGVGVATRHYKWTTSSIQPAWDSGTGWSAFADGSYIYSPNGVTGWYYLWVRSTDNLGNESFNRTNSFKLDNNPPVVSFGTNGNSTWAQSHSTTVTVSDANAGVWTRDYVWSTSTTTPTTGWTSFSDGETITTPTETGVYYLHIKGKDASGSGNITYEHSNGFYVENPNTINVTEPRSPTTIKLLENSLLPLHIEFNKTGSFQYTITLPSTNLEYQDGTPISTGTISVTCTDSCIFNETIFLPKEVLPASVTVHEVIVTVEFDSVDPIETRIPFTIHGHP